MSRRLMLSVVAVLLACCTCALRALGGEADGSTEAEKTRQVEEDRQEGELREQEGPVDKRWSVGLFTGVRYDDNITLRNEDIDVTDRGNKTDWTLIHALSVEYRPVNTAEHVLGLRYNAYQSFIEMNNQLQLTGHTMTAYYTAAGAPLVFNLPVSFSTYNLYWDRYVDIYSVAPSLFIEQNEHFVGVLSAGWSRYNYFQIHDNGFDEQDRDSNVLTVGFEEWFLFGDRAQYRIECGYTLRKELAADDEWSFWSHKARLGAATQLPWFNIYAGIFGSYEARNYDERNEVFGKTQEEDIATGGLSLTRPLGKYASVNLSYLFTDNDSNVISQDYERNQITLGLTVRF